MVHSRLLPILLSVLAPVILGAKALDLPFDLPARAAPAANLFEVPAPELERNGGQSFDDPWPWDGVEVSVYSGLYPVFFAASQGVDVGIPVLPWVSFVLKAEITAGLLLTGGIFDFGFRGHYNFSDTLGVYGEFTGRYGIGELTIAEIFEDFFKDVVDAGVNSISGLGFGLAGGVELGGRNFKFFAGLHYSALFVDTSLFVDDTSIDLPTITINHFGFQLGMRFYFG